MQTPSPSPQLSQKPRPHHISLLGQQLCAARWHQHSTVSEHSTTATPLPGAHAGGTRSCNPFLISQIHLFPLGKKTQPSKSKDKSAPGRGREEHTKQRHQNPTDLQCKAMHCKLCGVGNAACSHHTAQNSSRALGTFRARLPRGEYSLWGWVFLVVWGLCACLILLRERKKAHVTTSHHHLGCSWHLCPGPAHLSQRC